MKDANLEISFKDWKNRILMEWIVEFLISPNKGEPLKSLNKIASGGELSRIMLALKSIFVKSRGQTAILSMRLTQVYLDKLHKKWQRKCEI